MHNQTMMVARLHGAEDLRIDHVPHPGAPGPGHVLLRVTAVGVCGSDLHTYQDGRIGDTVPDAPVIIGHEFGGIIEAIGEQTGTHENWGGDYKPLAVGMRVAVDPAQPCGRCELCEHGHPNLCRRLHFCGLFPDEGSLCTYMHVPAHTCFPLPDAIDDAGAALLEPLGVAIHAIDLAKIQVANSVAILGAGAIGLYILQLAKLSGADPIFVSDKFDWRLAHAKRYGAVTVNCDQDDPVALVHEATDGRGVDVAIEAAWSDHSVQQAAEMARLGGRMVLVGIPGSDEITMQHSTIRRKGLTIRMSRRMKHTYPRAIQLAASGKVDLNSIISHRFPLEQAPEAFALNSNYQDEVVKVVIDI
ncbi:MAG: alcohol dehydrogenase catalytic domain-containing protein [Chloroflexota bacterium]